MTVTTQSFIAMCARSVASRPGYGASASGAFRCIPMFGGAGLSTLAPKHFATSGTDTNVWPLGPQEGSSG